jgi:hypothetical protein
MIGIASIGLFLGVSCLLIPDLRVAGIILCAISIIIFPRES